MSLDPAIEPTLCIWYSNSGPTTINDDKSNCVLVISSNALIASLPNDCIALITGCNLLPISDSPSKNFCLPTLYNLSAT